MLRILLDKFLKRLMSQSKRKEKISFSGKSLTICQSNIPKTLGSGTVSGKTYNSSFSESFFRSDTDFRKTDLIANDPFFSQVEQTIQEFGLEKANELLGDVAMAHYFLLYRNRLERSHRGEF